MNPARELFVFVRLNWRIIALCAMAAVIVAALIHGGRNRGRFVRVEGTGFILDTRTGQYCNPWPSASYWSDTPPSEGQNLAYKQDQANNGLPRCADLAKGWW
jgi:hypothetical protein